MSKPTRRELEIPKIFVKVYSKKPASMRAAIDETLQRLAEDIRHPSLRTKKMQGSDGVYEARVDRGNRVTFRLDGSKVKLLNNCNHKLVEP